MRIASSLDCHSETKQNVVDGVRLHRDDSEIDYYLRVNGFQFSRCRTPRLIITKCIMILTETSNHQASSSI